MNQPTDLDAVLESIAGQRIAAVPASARAVHRTILSAFAETGDAPARARLGDDLALETLAANDLIGTGDSGEIVYAYPFSARPTAHRLRLPGGPQPYAMCAIDALGIPAMLDTDAVITSRDPHTGEPVTVTVTDHGATATWQPAETVVFVGSRKDCRTTTAQSCCGYLNFFTDRGNAEAWAAEHPEVDGVVLDQYQALELGVRCFGELLRP